MTTLYTAKKYAVPALEAHCVEFLTKHLRADNAFMLLIQARLFDEPQLASLCLDTIDKSTVDAISAEGFTDIDIGEFLLVRMFSFGDSTILLENCVNWCFLPTFEGLRP